MMRFMTIVAHIVGRTLRWSQQFLNGSVFLRSKDSWDKFVIFMAILQTSILLLALIIAIGETR